MPVVRSLLRVICFFDYVTNRIRIDHRLYWEKNPSCLYGKLSRSTSDKLSGVKLLAFYTVFEVSWVVRPEINILNKNLQFSILSWILALTMTVPLPFTVLSLSAVPHSKALLCYRCTVVAPIHVCACTYALARASSFLLLQTVLFRVLHLLIDRACFVSIHLPNSPPLSHPPLAHALPFFSAGAGGQRERERERGGGGGGRRRRRRRRRRR